MAEGLNTPIALAVISRIIRVQTPKGVEPLLFLCWSIETIIIILVVLLRWNETKLRNFAQ